MDLRSSLRIKTRNPAFLWRMVLWVLAIGFGVGWCADIFFPHTEAPSVVENVERVPFWDSIEQMAEQGAWWRVWWRLPESMLADFTVGPAGLALLAGVCWFVFLWQALGEGRAFGRRWVGAVVAVGLGVCSVWPTLFLVVWQDVGLEFQDSLELVAGLRYNILGVGLREELAKLIGVMVLMPWLLRGREEATVLLWSACVGVGFAVEENMGYFSQSFGQAAMGRFLTANPFHMALTGLAGLALYRGLRYPRDWGAHALATLGLVVFAHGIYDASIRLPALADYAILNPIVFALVIYAFFHELRQLRPRSNDVISLSAIFLGGVALLMAVAFVYMSAAWGLPFAMHALAQDVLGLALMVYLFLREMPESMIGL